MEKKIKKNNILFFLFLLVIIGKLLAQEVVLERTLPPGWIFKFFHPPDSDSGLKALFLIQDLPDEIRATYKVASRLQVFDQNNNLVADLTLPEYHWFEGFIGDDKLLISEGDEGGIGRLKVVDFAGREIFSLEAGGRWVQQAVIGHDFALTPRLGHESGPISIIDGEKGIERLRIEPFPKGPQGEILPSCFLLLGDGYFVMGGGATLFLENYNEPGKKFWIIQNIGGNISNSIILSRDLIAIGFDAKADFKNNEFISGVAVIEWRTGKILFKKLAREKQREKDFWYPAIKYLNLYLEKDGSLIFHAVDEAVKLPREKAEGQEWNEAEAIKLRIHPSQKIKDHRGEENGRIEYQREYVIKDFGNLIRVEKLTWIF